jgi:uncharacterized protein YbaR (Trm112 family)
MVYCPNCQADHPRELLVCPDCKQELKLNTDTTQPVAEAPDDSWVAVVNIKGRKLAERAKLALDANNIPSIIVPHSFASPIKSPINSDGALEISGIDDNKLLMVPREFKIEAAILVKSVLRRELN